MIHGGSSLFPGLDVDVEFDVDEGDVMLLLFEWGMECLPFADVGPSLCPFSVTPSVRLSLPLLLLLLLTEM